ncbi:MULTISPECIES: DUF4960 domain-containing protein [Bacteroides]|uniref:DUF4960 domain-containing protein n=1 Tax=Bacteroides TaxID=816 RepID=UPI001E639176|nr:MULTISPECIES: DUF4960 domain-containing protein [Bacteroides]
MKKYFSLIMIMLSVSCLFLTACDDDKRDSLDFSQDVNIHEFTINGVQGVIDNETMMIKVMLPPKSDVTSLVPDIKVADNAVITPGSGESQNFSGNVEYKVTNGNLYNTYKVSVEVLNARITKFILNGRYVGTIDPVNNTISVTVPTTIDITKLIPTIEYTEGATISPENSKIQDFTNPVVYTLTYMNETFTYEVSVIQSDHTYAFLGTAETIDGLTNADEKTAAEWMMENIPNSKYVSLESLKDGAASLNQFTAVWFHYEQANTLPVIAANKNVTNVIKGYYSNGGNIFLSGTACLYTGSLGITPAAYTPNNAFGSFGDAGQVNAPGELWGIAITGCEEHPIYKGVTIDKTTQSWPVVWLVGKEISWRRNIGCPWDLVAPYTQDWADWASKTGGTPLASFNWDDDCNEKVAVSVFDGIEGGKGTAVCVGAPSYDWYYEKENVSSNSYYSNIEKMTLNIFNYLTK